ncbi:hypothetical protein F4813DRAFT_367375 [Daldinia decipiens]|uniref:uncharacterized protein n=1 Tax=Daldinia decipiens TaxID=326647 RepID=UPI0020C2BDF0|nr:uncharacterized protein F4813DRAFT_367375 [Daldinia decipiens]KAI1655563.1 hypothetical protein F4813DRAFT_367375 [Daldinia decipiens]
MYFSFSFFPFIIFLPLCQPCVYSSRHLTAMSCNTCMEHILSRLLIGCFIALTCSCLTGLSRRHMAARCFEPETQKHRCRVGSRQNQ